MALTLVSNKTDDEILAAQLAKKYQNLYCPRCKTNMEIKTEFKRGEIHFSPNCRCPSK